MGLRLVHSAEMYWPNRGELELGHRLTTEALHLQGANERTLHRCRALIVAGQQAHFLSRYRQAREFLEESQSIAREIGNQERLGAALLLLGRVSIAQDDRVAARSYLMESLALARSSGNKRGVSGALHSLADIQLGEGDVQAAITLFEQSLTLSREEGNHLNVALGLITLARLSIESRSIDRAREMLREAVVIAADINSQWAVPPLLKACAELGALLGEWPRTARFIGAFEAQRQLTGLSHDAREEGSYSRLKAQAQETLGETAFADAETAGHDLSLDVAIAEMRAWL
jgi:tetratricopeptide (TPR) repeat protein